MQTVPLRYTPGSPDQDRHRIPRRSGTEPFNVDDVQVDYTLGVGIANWTAALAAAACLALAALLTLVLLFKGYVVFRDSQRTARSFAGYFGIAGFFSVLFAGMLLALVAMIWGFVYACVNFLLNLAPASLIAFIKSDLANGSFSLRVVSIALPFSLVAPFRAWSAAKSKKSKGPAVADKEGDEGEEDQKQRDKTNKAIPIVMEGLLYLAATSVLWYSLVRDGKLTGLGVLLSFVLLFIIDDWVILSYYRMEPGREVPRSHALRLLLAAVAVMLLMVGMFYAVFTLPIAVLFTLVVVPLACMIVIGHGPVI